MTHKVKINGRPATLELGSLEEPLKGSWGEYSCNIIYDDDPALVEHPAIVQGDEHLIAAETIELL